MSEPVKKSLVKKLAEVMGLVERVAKSGRNEFHKYDYATEADIVSSVRGGLAERGIMLVPSIQKIEWTEKPGPKPSKIATITVLFTFMDGESGEKVEFIGMGQGEDASDKAIYKAMTGAEKYALLKTFLIPTGDDPEAEAKPQRNGAPQPPNGHARDVTRQLKSGAAVNGETTAERQAREAAKPGAKVPPIGPFEQIKVAAGEYGFDSMTVAALVKSSTGKEDRKQIVDADVPKALAAFKEFAATRAKVANTVGLEPPPHTEADMPPEPF